MAEAERSVVEVAYRLNLEVCPEGVSELLDSHILELNNEDPLETGERGVAEEELADETPSSARTYHSETSEAFCVESALKVFQMDDGKFEHSAKSLRQLRMRALVDPSLRFNQPIFLNLAILLLQEK
jgi:hypothetical protein